jgi:hypothetical protein
MPSGTFNVALDSANSLTHKIEDFVARIVAINTRLRSLSEKVSATANVINSMSSLVIRQAKNEGISDKDIDKNAKLAEVTSKYKDRTATEPEPEVLTRRCFKDIMEAIQGAYDLFEEMSKKIDDARETLILTNNLSQRARRSVPEPVLPQSRDGQVRLDEAEKERLLLTEEKISVMEADVESRKLDLKIMFFVFESVV